MAKRIFDLLIVGLTAPLWLSVIAGVAFVLILADGWPPFFLQQRPGKNGKPFRIIKFRTMRKQTHDAGEALSDAERITRVGNWIRHSSLDELPQLLNVLKGEMSLVGPRPLLMEYLPLYPEEVARRHDVLPGITGLAQISGRNLLSWEEKFAFDVEYVDNQSFGLDMSILLKTIQRVLQRRGVSSSEEATMAPYRGPEET